MKNYWTRSSATVNQHILSNFSGAGMIFSPIKATVFCFFGKWEPCGGHVKPAPYQGLLCLPPEASGIAISHLLCWKAFQCDLVSDLITDYVFLLTMGSSLTVWHFQKLAGNEMDDSIVNLHFQKKKRHCIFYPTSEILNTVCFNHFSVPPKGQRALLRNFWDSLFPLVKVWFLQSSTCD